MPDNTREDALFRAQMAEQAERYDEMVQAAKQLVSLVGATGELTADERSVLSVAFKNFTGTRRASWRILSGMESREETKADNGTSKKLDQIKKLREEVENEMRGSCGDIVQMLDLFLIPQAAAGESKVFYHKMKGDYYRYLAEFNSSDKKQISEKALQAYKEANEVANRELAPTHPIRLGLGLNFSVFYYEIMGSPERACRLAKTAFDDAIAELDNLNEDSYKDSSLIMQLLRDNLTLWSSDISDEKEVNGLVDGEN